jgi:hypothetical protein
MGSLTPDTPLLPLPSATPFKRRRPLPPHHFPLPPLFSLRSAPPAPLPFPRPLIRVVEGTITAPHHISSHRHSFFPTLGEVRRSPSICPFGPHLTSPISSNSYRSSSPPSLTTGPCRRHGTSMSHRPSSPSLSTLSLGEPLPPPPCQACCHCPHGARAAFTGTPCPSASPGRPRHRAVVHVATGGASAALRPSQPGQIGRWARARPLLCTGFLFLFSFTFPKIHINFKMHRKYSKT